MSSKLKQKRKICFVITSFIHYSRGLFILEELKNRPDVELHIVISGTALLAKYSSKFSYVKNILEREGYNNLHELYFNLEGDSHLTKAKTAGIGIVEFSTFFNQLRPDVVVLRGDRFEVLSAAVAAAYLQIPIAHLEGGDITGSIDESVRHAITKLSHLHFATNEDAKKRILRMG
ncbi:MAG: UDP-N-acetylglucosamine 2-epimerase, partial [Patescibacteria group bacterium]